MRFLFHIAFLFITAVTILAIPHSPSAGFVDYQRNPYSDSPPSKWKWLGRRALTAPKPQQRPSELQKTDLPLRSRIIRRRRIHP